MRLAPLGKRPASWAWPGYVAHRSRWVWRQAARFARGGRRSAEGRGAGYALGAGGAETCVLG